MTDQKNSTEPKSKATEPKTKAAPSTEGQLTTSGDPPVNDPGRAPFAETENLGYRPRSDAMAKSPNDVIPSEDRKWDTATRARWGETETSELQKEQQEIAENQRKADEKANR